MLFKELKEFMANDRAQHTILPLSKFGLIQITRQRTKPEIVINTSETCPVCEGTGKVSPSILIVDRIERDLEYIISSDNKQTLRVIAHPYIYSHLKIGIPSIQMKWFLNSING
ncbi:MAG: ribonuclease E/G [Saprospiraceae bacterium]